MSELFDELRMIFVKLRDPKNGCPWDIKQTPSSLQEYIIEEAHELTEAIADGCPDKQKEEMGDLLLQIFFLSQIMDEQKLFNIDDVMSTLKEKLIRRHPHIFEERTQLTDDEVKRNWENIKKKEKSKQSIISDYPDSMPALAVCKRISEQVASVGFDWKDANQIRKKIDEELLELENALTTEEQTEECGDLLFAIANLCRHYKVHPELALKAANRKFIKRFRYMEQKVNKTDKGFTFHSLEELDTLWEESKQENL